MAGKKVDTPPSPPEPRGGPFGGGRLVRQETLFLFTLLALAVGFFGGVLFGVWRSGDDGGHRHPPAPAAVASGPAMAERIRELEAETARNPSGLAAWIELGNLYFDTDQPRKAIEAYRRALALDPDNADVWTDLGVMYRREGNPEEAVRCFERAMAIDPRHEISRLNKGIVLLHDLKDEAGAIRAWEELLAINPLAAVPGGMTVDRMVQGLKQKTPPKPSG